MPVDTIESTIPYSEAKQYTARTSTRSTVRAWLRAPVGNVFNELHNIISEKTRRAMTKIPRLHYFDMYTYAHHEQLRTYRRPSISRCPPPATPPLRSTRYPRWPRTRGEAQTVGGGRSLKPLNYRTPRRKPSRRSSWGPGFPSRKWLLDTLRRWKLKTSESIGLLVVHGIGR